MGSRLKGSRCVPAPPTHRNIYAIERTTEEENSYRCLERFDLEARDDESIRRGVLETMDRKEGQRRGRRERRKCVWSVRSKRNGKEYHSSEKEKEEMGLNFKATSRNIRCLFSSFFFSPLFLSSLHPRSLHLSQGSPLLLSFFLPSSAFLAAGPNASPIQPARREKGGKGLWPGV